MKAKLTGVLVSLVLFATVVALVGAAQAGPDLVVNSIIPNCGGYLFANESNVIQAVIANTGDATAGASHASFVLSDGYSEKVDVPELAASATTTLSITDPTIRPAGTAVGITVTADCDDEVTEDNETNNDFSVVKTVMNNGYKGKRYTGGSDIATWQTFALQGNLLYSTGNSQYLSGSSTAWNSYTVDWNESDLPVPAAASIRAARLYVIFTWDKV
ncbi:MAG TPA: DUF3344 domain-containing protein, partial [Methanomicrobia archaeon]|nr:DUF3344 domain-containing protein [Methanomicrobia archaeon]